MVEQEIVLRDDDFDLDFLDEDDETAEETVELPPYRVLISDDDETVHQVTSTILQEFRFEKRKLEFLHAYTAAETKHLLDTTDDVAILLQDVVMDDDDTGLKIVEYLRDTLQNDLTRIIIRTGQPGVAPEEVIIANYDINDYKSKTELTVQKLYSSLYSCLRSYRDIKALKRHQIGLERIIKASSNIFKASSCHEFLDGILHQLATFYHENRDFTLSNDGMPGTVDGFIARDEAARYTIMAATGKYHQYIGQDIKQVRDLAYFAQLFAERQHSPDTSIQYLEEKGFLAYQRGLADSGNYIFMEGNHEEIEFNMIKVFLLHFSMAIDNFRMHAEMIETQNEIIYMLGELIEKRSEDTANHVRRMSEICAILAEGAGFPDKKCEEIRIASTMHDIGKIAIPDSILLKPGKLSEEEFAIMKTHAIEGYKILKRSTLGVLKTAAIIAKYHHEKYDGSGYPEGLRGEEIPDVAKITALADVFDALTHKRHYKEAWPISETIEYIRENEGRHFDPRYIQILIERLDDITKIVETYQDPSPAAEKSS